MGYKKIVTVWLWVKQQVPVVVIQIVKDGHNSYKSLFPRLS